MSRIRTSAYSLLVAPQSALVLHTSLFTLAPPLPPLCHHHHHGMPLRVVASESALAPSPSDATASARCPLRRRPGLAPPCHATSSQHRRLCLPPPPPSVPRRLRPNTAAARSAAELAHRCYRRPAPEPASPAIDTGRRASAPKVFFQVYFEGEQIWIKFEIQLTKFDYVRIKLTIFDYVTLKFIKFEIHFD
jgi:hypothetical protein